MISSYTKFVTASFPVAFAFGFAARFFSMLFGFISFQSNTPDAVNLGNVSLITFFFVCVLVGLPTYFTFQDKIIKRKDMSDKTLRVICAFITIPMSLYIYHSYF